MIVHGADVEPPTGWRDETAGDHVPGPAGRPWPGPRAGEIWRLSSAIRLRRASPGGSTLTRGWSVLRLVGPARHDRPAGRPSASGSEEDRGCAAARSGLGS